MGIPQGWGNWSSNVHYDQRAEVYKVSKVQCVLQCVQSLSKWEGIDILNKTCFKNRNI